MMRRLTLALLAIVLLSSSGCVPCDPKDRSCTKPGPVEQPPKYGR